MVAERIAITIDQTRDEIGGQRTESDAIAAITKCRIAIWGGWNRPYQGQSVFGLAEKASSCRVNFEIGPGHKIRKFSKQG